MKLAPIKFEGYDKRMKYVATRNECGTLYVRLKSRNSIEKQPHISGGLLNNNYILDNVHFHWDSEHIIYGKSYPVEAHFVHYLSSMGHYEKAKASKRQGAIAIIAIVFEILITTEPKWGPLDLITSFTCCNELETSLCLRDLLPSYLRSYYYYKDPLNNENNQNVTWIIMAVPGIITNWQYKNLTSVCGKGLKNMYPRQELANKDVRFVINGYLKDPKKLTKIPVVAVKTKSQESLGVTYSSSSSNCSEEV